MQHMTFPIECSLTALKYLRNILAEIYFSFNYQLLFIISPHGENTKIFAKFPFKRVQYFEYRQKCR